MIFLMWCCLMPNGFPGVATRCLGNDDLHVQKRLERIFLISLEKCTAAGVVPVHQPYCDATVCMLNDYTNQYLSKIKEYIAYR